MKILKFGGTSVADLERIRRVGRLVAAEVAAGHKVAVVVSAMAGKTNELVAWTDAAVFAGAAERQVSRIPAGALPRSSGTERRLPSGQMVARDWPILHLWPSNAE